MNRVLLIIGGLLVGLLAALFVVPVFVDWTRYRGTFEEEATRMLGRDVRVGGKVNLRLLPTPYVRFEKIRVADTKATVGKPLFNAEDFTLWLSIGALLRGEFEASVVELHKPVLTLVLDDKGGGNWTNLPETSVKPAYAPSAFGFDSIRINNGTIAIYGATGDERTRFEHINGEVSSPALEGPYKIAAAFAHAGAPREIRMSTAKPEPDGAIRLKGTVRAPSAGINYAIDGKLIDLFQNPRFQGELSAQLPLPALTAPDGLKQQTPAAPREASFDLKSGIKADASGAEFNDLALTYDQDSQPQLATGSARVIWRDRTIATAKLHSRWLDLDRVSGRTSSMHLAEQLQQLLKSLDGALPLDGQTNIGIDLDQVTLGGDIVSGVTIKAERKDGILNLDANAAIPGGGRVEARGVIQASSKDRLFDGDINLRGTSASRFLAWAGRNTTVPQVAQDGPFNVSGKAVLGLDNVSARGLDIQFGGNRLAGGASWSQGVNGRQITLALDGAAMDLTPLAGPETSPLAALRGIAAKLADWPNDVGVGPTESAPGTKTPGTNTGAGNAGNAGKTSGAPLPSIVARLRIGQLTAGRGTFHDVATDLRFEAGRLSISELKFGSETGWSVDVQGDIADLARPGSVGAMTWEMTAGSANALREVLGLTGLAGPWLATPERTTALVPLHMGGRLRIGEASKGTYDVTFDGNLGPTRASGSARIDAIDGKGEGWRDAKSDIAVTLEGADIGRMMEQLAPPSWRPAPGYPRQPGRIAFRGIGPLKTGLVSLATLETPGLATEYRGRLIATDSAQLALDGDLRLAAADIGQSLALAGVRQRTSLTNQPVSGVIALSGSLDRLRLVSAGMTAGTATLSGNLDLEQRAAGPRLTGKITTSELGLAAMLGLLTQPRIQSTMGPPPPPASPGAAAQLPAAARPSFWSDDAFDLSVIAGIESQILINADRTYLTPELILGKSAFDMTMKAGRIDLKLTEAAVLGGTVTGSLQLERNAAGATAKTALRLNKAHLEAFAAPGTKPAATGAMNVVLGLEGTALSPHHLITALRGKGEMTIGDGRLDRLSPKNLSEMVEAILTTKGELPPDELARRISTAIGSSPSGPGSAHVTIGQRTLALQVAEGIVRIAPLQIESSGGRLTGTTALDLEAQRFDSEWQIEANTGTGKNAQPVLAKPKPPLPAVKAVYAGSLAQIGAIEPRLQFDGLAREIAVRKLERDLEELERLRKLDEERVRIETERRKQLEAERAAAVTPSATPNETRQIIVPLPVLPLPERPPPPVLIQPPQPATRPGETTNGALAPSAPETTPPTTPSSLPESPATPAAAAPNQVSDQPRPGPQSQPPPKATRKEVFKDQSKAAP